MILSSAAKKSIREGGEVETLKRLLRSSGRASALTISRNNLTAFAHRPDCPTTVSWRVPMIPESCILTILTHELLPSLAVSNYRRIILLLMGEKAGMRASSLQPRDESLTNWFMGSLLSIFFECIGTMNVRFFRSMLGVRSSMFDVSGSVMNPKHRTSNYLRHTRHLSVLFSPF